MKTMKKIFLLGILILLLSATSAHALTTFPWNFVERAWYAGSDTATLKMSDATSTWIVAATQSIALPSDSEYHFGTAYTETKDILNEFDANTGSFTALVSGYYLISGNATYEYNPNGSRFFYCYTAGSVEGWVPYVFQNPVETTYSTTLTYSSMLYMAAGAQLRPAVGQWSGSTLSTRIQISIRRIP